MIRHEYVVVDTNVWISSAFSSLGKPARCLIVAKEKYKILLSRQMLGELTEKMLDEKFQQLGTLAERLQFVNGIYEACIDIEPDYIVSVSEDADDDMFISAALSAGAKYIISGDPHLKKLRNFRGVRIVSPAEFLEAEKS